LTRALLAEGADKVIAVERDERCLPALADISAAYPGKLDVISADAMAIDEASLLPQGARIAANLPYNVGTALLIRWLTLPVWPPFWARATLMFQRALRPSERAGAVALLGEDSVRREPAGFRAATVGDLVHRAAGAAP
jgi:16S rRNA A1518/A1519 N6-dimethyltransferase RsmA/KsgA/DIM1 with predicted DNA glycosylase/AP lyase activity